MSEEIAWLAGLLEGEGYFGLRKDGALQISLAMTDADIVDRAKAIIGRSSIKTRQLPSGKTCYTLCVGEQGTIVDLMRKVLPYMGARRSAKIEHCLAERAKRPMPKRNWTHCVRGHPLEGDNLRIAYEGKYRKRRCIECCKLRQRKHRAKAA